MKGFGRFSVARGASHSPRAMIGACLFLSLVLASPATATLKQALVDPAQPSSCDSVRITVAGDLPDDCYEIVGATIRGPELLPCMRPGPCPWRFVVEITVREPNLQIVGPCSLVAPYSRSFAVGRLPAGEYLVAAQERVFPFAADSTDSIIDQSFANTTFNVLPDSTCASIPGCYMLGFARVPVVTTRSHDLCTAVAEPGGIACLDLTLTNTRAAGGLQTVLQLSEPDSLPAEAFLNAVSVDPVGRAAGFQVGWTSDGSRTTLLLYSTSAASIAPGDGPVARICYSVPPETAPQTFRVFSTATLVSDPEGNSIPPCLIPIAPGFICIGTTACDVNGDGVSDVLDIIRIVRCVLAGGSDSTSTCPDSVAGRADCNGDGSLDIRDVVCCVRKIVGTGVTFPDPVLPPRTGEIPAGASSIGFDGAVRWINAIEGVAIVRIDADQDWGGAQFVINPSSTPVRIRSLSLDATSARTGSQLESAVDGLGIAHVMLYETTPGARPAHTYRILVRLERAPSGSGSDPIRIQGVKAGTSEGAEAAISAINSRLTIEAPASAAPTLLGARPNPTSGVTEIGFALPSDGKATLRIYDVTGRLVRTLAEGPQTAGVHRARWDGLDARGRAARSGIYFAKLETGSTIRSERILLLR